METTPAWREHADHRREDDERHHARLGERVAARSFCVKLWERTWYSPNGREPRKAKKFNTTSETSRSAAPALWAAASASGRPSATLATRARTAAAEGSGKRRSGRNAAIPDAFRAAQPTTHQRERERAVRPVNAVSAWRRSSPSPVCPARAARGRRCEVHRRQRCPGIPGDQGRRARRSSR